MTAITGKPPAQASLSPRVTLQPPWRYSVWALIAWLLLGPAWGQQPDRITIIPIKAPERPSGIRQMNLAEVLELGIQQNPQMQVAAERIEQARATYLQQKSQKVPQLVLTNSTTIQRESSINTGNLLGSFRSSSFPDRFVLQSPVSDQFKLSLQVLLTTFGKVENEIAAAFLQIDVESAAAAQDVLTLTYQIKQAYFAKLQSDAQVEVSRLNLSVSNQNLDDTQALFDQGVMSRYDILQAQIEVTSRVQDLAQNLTDVDQASAQLANVLAERRFHVQPIEPPPVAVQPEIELPALENYALAHRPEMLSIVYNRAVAQKLLDAAYGESNPYVTLAANYQTHFGQSLSALDLPSLTLQVQWPIFDGGFRKAKVRQAESVLREIDASEALVVNQILQEVEQYWLDLQQTAFTMMTAEQQLANTIEYYDMARRRYLNGLATTLEVSDALRNLVAARADLVEARYSRDLAFARLEQALGEDVPDRNLTLEFLSTPVQDGMTPPQSERADGPEEKTNE